jgi:hypothetical protein
VGVAEVARALEVSPRTARRLLADGALDAEQTEAGWEVPLSALAPAVDTPDELRGLLAALDADRADLAARLAALEAALLADDDAGEDATDVDTAATAATVRSLPRPRRVKVGA